MTFTDAFADTNGVLLQNHGTGWTKLCGDDFDIQSNTLRRNAATSGVFTAYLRPDDGSVDQRAGADIAATFAGPAVLLSGTGAADLNGYILRRTSGTSIRINRIDNGVLQSTNYALVTVANTLNLEIRATVSGSTVTFDVLQSGVSIGVGTGTGSDNSAGAHLSGHRGLCHATAATMSSGGLDNYTDNYSSIPFAVTNIADNEFVEGYFSVRAKTVTGTYTGSPTQLQARLVDSGGTAISGFDWANISFSGGTFSAPFTGIPKSTTKYFVQIRDSAVPATVLTSASGFWCGAVPYLFGQSQSDHLINNDLGGVTPTPGMKAFVIRCVPQSGANAKTGATPTYSRIDIVANPGSVGSATIQAANEFWALEGMPIQLVEQNYSGSNIDTWVNDAIQSTSPASTVKLFSEVAGPARTLVNGQCSMILMRHGTADATNYSNNYIAYKAQIDALKAKFEAALPGMSPLFVIMPHARSNDVDDTKTWDIRKAQWEKATSGGQYRLGGYALDITMDVDGGPHQSDGGTAISATTGVRREGLRVGRAIASALNPSLNVNILGPRVINNGATWVDAAIRNAIRITFDRDIKRADGTVGIGTTFIPDMVSVSTNGGLNFSPLAQVDCSLTQTGARTVDLARTDGGAWPLGTTNIDFFHGVPFLSAQTPAHSPAISEATLETNYFSKTITDMSSFDGSRGVPVAPYFGAGVAVGDYNAGGDGPTRAGVFGLGFRLGF